jgi:hypothetical protein
MGSTEGHVLPGAFFLFWAHLVLLHYYYALRKGKPYVPQEVGSLWEALLGVTLCTVGILAEAGRGEWKQPLASATGAHILLYSTFLVTTLAGALQSLSLIPKRTTYFFIIQSFLLECVIFGSHMQDSELPMMFHNYLVLTMYANIIATALEMWLPHQPLVFFLRPFALTLHGAWFCATGVFVFGQYALPWPMDISDGMNMDNAYNMQIRNESHMKCAFYFVILTLMVSAYIIVIGYLIPLIFIRLEFCSSKEHLLITSQILKAKSNGYIGLEIQDGVSHKQKGEREITQGSMLVSPSAVPAAVDCFEEQSGCQENSKGSMLASPSPVTVAVECFEEQIGCQENRKAEQVKGIEAVRDHPLLQSETTVKR